MRSILLSLAVFTASAAVSRGAVIVSGNVSTNGAPCTLTITDDITLQLNTPNFKFGSTDVELVFQNWSSATSTATTSITLGQSITVSVDGFPTQFTAYLVEGWVFADNDISSHDAYLGITLPLYPAGTTITYNAGTYAFTGSSSYSPNVVQSFTGNMFLTDGYAYRISDIVPEPSTALLGLLGVTALFGRRRAA
jgi:hypothetical protein